MHHGSMHQETRLALCGLCRARRSDRAVEIPPAYTEPPVSVRSALSLPGSTREACLYPALLGDSVRALSPLPGSSSFTFTPGHPYFSSGQHCLYVFRFRYCPVHSAGERQVSSRLPTAKHSADSSGRAHRAIERLSLYSSNRVS